MSGLRKQERQEGLEIGRIIGCFFVILIHQAPSSYGHDEFTGEIINQIARWAVPYFFIVSGYFTKKDVSLSSALTRVFLRLAPIFIAWEIFYFMVWNPEAQIERFNADPVRFIYGVVVNGMPGYHLWFLSSLGACLILLSILVKWFEARTVLGLLVVLYAVGLAFDSYAVVLGHGAEAIPYNTRNFPFMPPLFFFAGYYIRHLGWKFDGVALLFIGLVLSAIEIGTLWLFFDVPVNNHDFVMGTLPLGLGAFFMFREVTLRTPALANAVRRLGAVTLGTYAVHLFVLNRLSDAIPADGLLSALSVAGLTLVVSFAIAYALSFVPLVRRMV